MNLRGREKPAAFQFTYLAVVGMFNTVKQEVQLLITGDARHLECFSSDVKVRVVERKSVRL